MKAVILAGGEGRRLRPYTLTIPKPMMPIGDRPILELLVAQLRSCGIDDLVFATGHLGEIIRGHFGDGRDFGVSIRYSKEERALGTAGPLDLLRTMLDATFLMINGDILADLDLAAIIAEHRRRASDVTVVIARHAETVDFGVIGLDEHGDVASWSEKPVVERLVSAGAYVLEPATLAHLAPGAYADLPDFVMALVRAGMRVRGHVHAGYWLDIGRPADYERACRDASRVARPCGDGAQRGGDGAQRQGGPMNAAPRVLIAGGTGFIGAAIARRLRADGADVQIASRAAGVDLTEWDAVARIGRVDAIVHAAGSPSVPSSLAAPRPYYRDHFLVTLNLLELARVTGARLVLASTYVYGTAPRVPAAEADAAQAHSPYTASRLLAEQLCREYRRDFGVSVDVLRVFNAYGPGQPDTFLVPKVVAGAVVGRIALADPAPRRDFVHVDDVACAFALAARRDADGGETFNIGSGESQSVDEVARVAVRLAGGAVEISYSGVVRAGEIADARADIAKAARLLLWRPTIGFEAGLASLIAAAKGARS